MEFKKVAMPVKENAPSHSENELHVLILEDIPSDAELAQRELKKTLQNYTVEVVDTREGFVQALETFKPDLIISDFMLPTFDGLSALKIKLDIAPMTPFVMLTGSMNEATAVECMKAGADDYVIKEHIRRLGPAALNALEKKKAVKEKEQTLTELHEKEAYLKSVLQAAPVGIGVVLDRKIIDVNQHFCNMLGYSEKELIGQNSRMVYPDDQEYERVGTDKYEQIKNTGLGVIETQLVHKDGHLISVLLSSTPIDARDQSKGITFSAMDITERTLVSKALGVSESRYRQLFDNLPYGCEIIDLKGRIVECNSSTSRMLGYDKTELIGNHITNFVSAESKKLFRQEFPKVLNGETIMLEIGQKHKNGQLINVLRSGTPIFNVSGEVESLLGLSVDITELKRIEKEIVNLESNFKLLADYASDWEYLIDANQKYRYHSSARERITGYTVEEFLTDPDLQFKIIRKDHRSSIAEHYASEHNQDTPVCTLEFPIVHKDGTERWLQHHCSPVYDINGKFLGRRGSNRDITKRKLAQKTLMESEEKYRLIVENANDGIEITQDNKIIYANKRFAKILGYTINTVKHKRFSEIFTEQALQDLYERQKKRKSNKFHNFSYETTFYKKDGSIIDVEIKAEIIDYNGKPATFAIVRDITKQKQADEEIARALLEAKHANAVKDQFIANISHEIRTPLNSILGFSDILGNRFGDRASEADKKIFTYINSAGNRLMRTVDAILNMSQLQAGLVRLHPQKLNLSKLVLAVIKDLKPAADEKQLEFRYKSPPQPVLVFVDEYSIQQVLLNLIENAIKYTKEGSVELKQDLKEDQVVLSVIDTGVGIPAEHQQRIFEPYTQESEGYTKAYQGVGLGLAITKKYLELNNVKLGLFSQPDIGSTFTLTFPIVKEQAHV